MCAAYKFVFNAAVALHSVNSTKALKTILQNGKKWKRCAHEEKNERKTIPLHKQVPMKAMNMNVRMAEGRLAYAKPGGKIEIPALYI